MSTGNTADVAPRSIPVIGIVGGVGSGKSAVTRALAGLTSVAIIDADQLGHQALDLPGVREQLRQRFGPAIFDAAGSVVRPELARRVFGPEPAEQLARADLEAITHPVISRLAAEQIAGHRSKRGVRWIVLDAALLLEARWRNLCDVVVFIDVPADRRLEQVKNQRGWSEAEWQRREASQWPVARKQAAADFTIANHGPVDRVARDLLAALLTRWPECGDGFVVP